jgi:riboflavin kinase / FMN adenylyltransferase
MKIHTDFSSFTNVTNAIVTIGTFDGVHAGHLSIIERVKEIAVRKQGESVLLTFYPHPRMVLYPNDHGLQLLNTPQEKAKLLEAAGIQHLMVYPFSKEFSRLSAFDYVRDLIVNGLHAKTVVVGYDHRFGHNREGDHSVLLDLAETFKFEVEEIPAQTLDAINVSSTKIRQALLGGQVSEAAKYLGRNYALQGTVVHGDKLNLGIRPTTHHNSKVTIEVYILDFHQEVYGKQIEVEFVERLRDEKKFGSIDELKECIAQDVVNAKNYV